MMEGQLDRTADLAAAAAPAEPRQATRGELRALLELAFEGVPPSSVAACEGRVRA